MNCFYAREGGFSLVELMVAVGIIGIMSSVAVPKYQKFRANAAQSEAQATLSSIYTLQQLFYTENDRYGDIKIKYADTTGRELDADGGFDTGDELKFLPSASARYRYQGKKWKADGTSPGTETDAVRFSVTADSETALASCAKDQKADKWCINEDKHLSNTKALSPCVDAEVQDGGCTHTTEAPPAES